VLAILGAVAVYAQNVHAQSNDKYSLISAGGIVFSDLRGYEDWAVVSSATLSFTNVFVRPPLFGEVPIR